MNEDSRGWSSDPLAAARWLVLIAVHEHRQSGSGTIWSIQDAGAETQAGTAAALAAYEYGVARGWVERDQGLVPASSGLLLRMPGVVEVGQWVRMRDDARHRRIACREALLDWMYAADGEVLTADPFLGDVRASHYGKAFTAAEIRRATEELVRDNFVAGHTSWQGQTSRINLTRDGEHCVEAYDAVIADWRSGHRNSAATSISGDTYNINADGSTGTLIAAGSRHVRQRAEIKIGGEAPAELAALIERFAALVNALPLGASESEEVRDGISELVEEAAQEEPDRSRVRRILGVIFTAVATVAAEEGTQEILKIGGEIMKALGV